MNDLLAIIGGTGVDLRGADSPLRDAHDETISTRWGTAFVTRAHLANSEGNIGGREIIFLHRHANPRHPTGPAIPPHSINYRANIAALKRLGVTGILASTAVGSLRPEWPAGTLVLLDQFIDCTSNRAKTFFDERAVHIDVTEPYCGHVRALLLKSAEEMGIALHDGGTYLCADGPRFETPAEIRAYARWGADVVGMTGVPEATLAREANISYAGVSVVANAAAGISPHPLTHTEVVQAMSLVLPDVARLFLHAARQYQDDPSAPARNATAEYEEHHLDAAELFG